jgi:hypothetical protein
MRGLAVPPGAEQVPIAVANHPSSIRADSGGTPLDYLLAIRTAKAAVRLHQRAVASLLGILLGGGLLFNHQ